MLPVQKYQFYKNYIYRHFAYKQVMLMNLINSSEEREKITSNIQFADDKEFLLSLKYEVHFSYLHLLETLFEFIFAIRDHGDENLWHGLANSGQNNYQRISKIADDDFSEFDEPVVSYVNRVKTVTPFLNYVFYMVFETIDENGVSKLQDSLDVIRKSLTIFAKEFDDRRGYNAYKHSYRLFQTMTEFRIGSPSIPGFIFDFSDSFTILPKGEEFEHLIINPDINRDYQLAMHAYQLLENIIWSRRFTYLRDTEPKLRSFDGIDIDAISSRASNKPFQMTLSTKPVYMKNIRLIAPFWSFRYQMELPTRRDQYHEAKKRLEMAGYNVMLPSRLNEYELLKGESIGSNEPMDEIDIRLQDLTEALQDDFCDIIMVFTGGNESTKGTDILSKIDWAINKECKKKIIGHSQATVLLNPLFDQTNMKVYYGVNFLDLGHPLSYNAEMESTIKFFQSALKDSSFNVPNINSKFKFVSGDDAKGQLVGGNLEAFSEIPASYSQNLSGKILMLEVANISNSDDFIMFLRTISSTNHGFSGLTGLIIGHFTGFNQEYQDKLLSFIHDECRMKNLTIVYGPEFGHHSCPRITLPIGKFASITKVNGECIIMID